MTGPSSATKAILFIYDIFGYFDQTTQGADILATAGKEQYQVFMPDFFDGGALDITVFPPDTEEKQKTLGDFFQGIGAPPKAAERVPSLVKEFLKYNSNIKTVGVVGMCWGGKVVSLTSGSNTPFTVAASCHPAMVDPSEAADITVPFCLLASKDEDAEAVSSFESALKGDKHVETFTDQIHGWMAARSNLEDAHVKKEYERGYKTLLQFFGKHL